MTTAITNVARADLPAILDIYNEVIRNSTAVYSDVEFTPPQGEQWLAAKANQGFPFLLARQGTEVVGFGSLSDFRAWPCYRFSVEHSVHVRADRRGQGIGRLLVGELMVRAQALGKHVMLAGIDADNAVSIGMHERLGFSRVAHLHEVGFKFGRWLDLVFLQRIL